MRSLHWEGAAAASQAYRTADGEFKSGDQTANVAQFPLTPYAVAAVQLRQTGQCNKACYSHRCEPFHVQGQAMQPCQLRNHSCCISTGVCVCCATSDLERCQLPQLQQFSSALSHQLCHPRSLTDAAAATTCSYSQPASSSSDTFCNVAE
jgi:hypothetical protein